MLKINPFPKIYTLVYSIIQGKLFFLKKAIMLEKNVIRVLKLSSHKKSSNETTFALENGPKRIHSAKNDQSSIRHPIENPLKQKSDYSNGAKTPPIPSPGERHPTRFTGAIYIPGRQQ